MRAQVLLLLFYYKITCEKYKNYNRLLDILRYNIQHLFKGPTSLFEKQHTWYPGLHWPSIASGQYKTKVQSLQYLCCSHDCSCGCNIQPFSPKMHQRVIAFVLSLADVFINILGQKKQNMNVVSLLDIMWIMQCWQAVLVLTQKVIFLFPD